MFNSFKAVFVFLDSTFLVILCWLGDQVSIDIGLSILKTRMVTQLMLEWQHLLVRCFDQCLVAALLPVLCQLRGWQIKFSCVPFQTWVLFFPSYFFF